MSAQSPQDTPRFIKACRGEPVDTTPIWVMRQAGRYLPEYQATRAEADGFLGLCKTPALAAEVTLQPIRRFKPDAGIIFSDIMIPVEAMGMELTFDQGPKLPNPLKGAADIEKLIVPDPVETMPFVMEAIRLFKAEAKDTPLIGFCGAPYTLASYMIEGGGSKNYIETKKLMMHEPKLWRVLNEKIAKTVAVHLKAQVEAGCSVVQIFDSWAGSLSPDDYKTFALPYCLQIIDELKSLDVPIILFAKGAHASLGELAGSGADVLGIDWSLPLDRAREMTGNKVTLQGNLDPVALFGPVERIERQVQRILNEAQGCRGHVFNLGHGILPKTPPEHMAALVDAVHRLGKRRVPE